MTQVLAVLTLEETLATREVHVVLRDKLFAVSGALVGLMGGYGLLTLANLLRGPLPTGVVTSMVLSPPRDGAGDGGVDPAMIANANLTSSVVECTRQLRGALDDDAHLEQELEAARTADAGPAAQERRIARRNLSPKDWKELAETGTVKYLLPCASFNPAPETMDRLGLAARDVPVVRDAFAAARESAWTRIRPLCVSAVGGGAGQADLLGLESCPQVILASAKGANPSDTDNAMRGVAFLRAGVSDPSAPPADGPIGSALLALTEVAKDAEGRIGSQLGAEDARVLVYGSNNCSHMVELAGPGTPRER
jgi:hypothetical protein